MHVFKLQPTKIPKKFPVYRKTDNIPQRYVNQFMHNRTACVQQAFADIHAFADRHTGTAQ